MKRMINFYVLVDIPSTNLHRTYFVRSSDKESAFFKMIHTYKIPEVSIINIVEAPEDEQGDIFFESKSKNHKP